ncbi:NAD-dependent epimerase/dehydratase family protein [Nocardia sp. NPDC050710]|uniref:NAD-dependent epimerase/dehydratase family protein n=1 Tax=Nocardia sp. NPDC050710 TaxID=3157220 RepID=UPI0033D4585E
MRVLVTGANGYLGSVVARELRTAGHDVVGLVHRHRSRIPTDMPTRTADLRDPGALTAALDGMDAVCHLAGLTRARESLDEPERYFAVNHAGTAALLHAMAAADSRALVFASTAAIYGTPDRQPMSEDLPDHPPHPYAASKLAAELAIAAATARGTLSAIVLRLFNIVGGDDTDETRIMSRLLAVAAGEQLHLTVPGDGTSVRDYLHLTDAARAFTAALARMPGPGACRRYNIGTGVGISVNELVTTATRITGRPIPVEYHPAIAEPPRLVSDSRRARDELDWAPAASDIDTVLRVAWAARAPSGYAPGCP